MKLEVYTLHITEDGYSPYNAFEWTFKGVYLTYKAALKDGKRYKKDFPDQDYSIEKVEVQQ